MRVLAGLGLGLLFATGAAIGIAAGFLIFWISLYRSARAVHADGVVCRAEITATDAVVGPRLAGDAVVRLSGALEDQATTGTDILGLELRTRKPNHPLLDGDQDLVFGTFESFHTVQRDRARTDAGDYLANQYHSVTPWWIPGRGPGKLRITPPPAAPRDRGANRLARLDADLAADRARFALALEDGTALATIRLVERLPADTPALHVSMFRTGRGLHPLGLRNGIRATVYPFSQLGRRIRGG